MDRKALKSLFNGIYRKNGIVSGKTNPGSLIADFARLSAKRNRAKKLQHFDLWNEIYDEYFSWILSVNISIYSNLKSEMRSTNVSCNKELQLSINMLFMRLVADLFSVRMLCREGFDVSAKVLARTTVEHIDLIILLLTKPSLSSEFWGADTPEESNKFWHKYIKGGKVSAVQKELIRSRLGEDIPDSALYDVLYDFQPILGASTHPSQLASMFSALSIGSGSTDNWLGIFGDRAEISCDTFYHLVLHMWKISFLFPDFPFGNEHMEMLGLSYSADDKFNRHAKEGGAILAGFLPRIWDPEISTWFFKEYDVSNIWPES